MSDESLFREVDEEVRQEQFKKLWERYGGLAVALCVVIVAGVAGYKGWQYWQVKQSDAAAESFFSATAQARDGKTLEAEKQFATITHRGYGILARLREAGLLAAQGKAQDAVTIYDGVAADEAADAALRDLAKIRAGYVLADSLKPADLSARLAGLDGAGNPWRHAAREINGIAQWRTADYAGAQATMSAILADPETPAAMRQRATTLSQLLLPLLASR